MNMVFYKKDLDRDCKHALDIETSMGGKVYGFFRPFGTLIFIDIANIFRSCLGEEDRFISKTTDIITHEHIHKLLWSMSDPIACMKWDIIDDGLKITRYR